VIGFAVADGGGLWVFDYTAVQLPDGLHVFTATDDQNRTSTPFAVTVRTVPPTGVILIGGTVPENQPAGTPVGTFDTPDGRGTLFTYRLVAGTGSADNATFSIQENRLVLAGPLDFEAKATYTVRVRAETTAGLGVEQAFTVTVADVYEGPTGLSLSASSVEAGQPACTLVGTLGVTAVPGTLAFALTPGTGGDDNAAFFVSGDRLFTAAPRTQGAGSRTIRVTVFDALGLSTERAFTLAVVPDNSGNTPPTISPVSDQTVAPDGEPIGPLAFTIGDAQTPAAQLVVAVQSSNSAIVSNNSIDLAGSGAARTVTIHPAFGATGAAIITLTVTDAGGLTTQRTFLVTVSSTAIGITPGSLPVGFVGWAYSQLLTASGAAGPFDFTVTSGSLPVGLSLSISGMLSGTTTTAGVYSFSVRADNGTVSSTRAYTISVDPPLGPPPPPPGTPGQVPVVVGGLADGSATVYSPSTGSTFTIQPFGLTVDSVRTAASDVDGDDIPDLIFVTGPGTPIRVAVVSGADNTTKLVAPFDPFGGNFTGGGFVAAADLDGDGRAEFAVTPDEGGGPRVSIFSLLVSGQVRTKANFFGIDDEAFRGGARAALGDIDGDGTPDLLLAAGFGGGPRVAIFRGDALFSTRANLVGDFFAFPEDAATLRNGVFAAAGDINGDGFADLIFGGGPGGGPRVYILSGEFLVSGNQNLFSRPIANFFVDGNGQDRGGVRLAVKNADGDSKADLVVGSGAGSPAKVRVYHGTDFSGTDEPVTFQNINVFGSAVLADGVYVG
jgi:hypothetical protein